MTVSEMSKHSQAERLKDSHKEACSAKNETQRIMCQDLARSRTRMVIAYNQLKEEESAEDTASNASSPQSRETRVKEASRV